MMAAEGGALQQAKLVLLGDMGAGKSSVVLRFVKGQFFDYQVSPPNKSTASSTIMNFAVCREPGVPRENISLS
jgi:Ras-related protein Rab-5C